MEAKEIRDFLTHLGVEKRVSARTQNQAFSALHFLYQQFLKIELEGIDGVGRAKRPQRIRTVSTIASEVGSDRVIDGPGSACVNVPVCAAVFSAISRWGIQDRLNSLANRNVHSTPGCTIRFGINQ